MAQIENVSGPATHGFQQALSLHGHFRGCELRKALRIQISLHRHVLRNDLARFLQRKVLVNTDDVGAEVEQRLPVARAFGKNDDGNGIVDLSDDAAQPFARPRLEQIVRQQAAMAVKQLDGIDTHRDLHLEK